jgi:hypothetical protein
VGYRELRGMLEQRRWDRHRTGGRVRDCDIHHNGQIGIADHGRDIGIESNRIWSNNIYGFK